MFEIEPYIPTSQENYEDNLWVKEECFRYYVEVRRESCDYMQILDLWLKAPCCFDCAVDDPFWRDKPPDISPKTLIEDIGFILGDDFLEEIENILNTDDDYYFTCKKCRDELRPMDDDIFVVNYHLEEHYGIPLEDPTRVNTSNKLRNQIFKLYDKKCFKCGDIDNDLHIDHILPRSKGGTSAFRNLQPLCEKCGNLKSDKIPEEVEIYSLMYFGDYPSDGYEGLFW